MLDIWDFEEGGRPVLTLPGGAMWWLGGVIWTCVVLSVVFSVFKPIARLSG